MSGDWTASAVSLSETVRAFARTNPHLRIEMSATRLHKYCGHPPNPVIITALKWRFMKEGENYNYEIRKHNFQSMSGGTSVGVVKGRARAELTVEAYDRKLAAEEKEAGDRKS